MIHSWLQMWVHPCGWTHCLPVSVCHPCFQHVYCIAQANLHRFTFPVMVPTFYPRWHQSTPVQASGCCGMPSAYCCLANSHATSFLYMLLPTSYTQFVAPPLSVTSAICHPQTNAVPVLGTIQMLTLYSKHQLIPTYRFQLFSNIFVWLHLKSGASVP